MKKLTQNGIIKHLALGHTYKEISASFKVSPNALYHHLKRIRRKGLEPTDVNACRRFILGPNAKPMPTDFSRCASLTPTQEKVLSLIDSGHTIQEITHIVQIGLQTARNTAAEAFKRAGIIRVNKPARVWKAQLRGYLQSTGIHPLITMEDPAFN